MYFYELHEGDDEIYQDLLLVHEEEISPQEFFEIVQVVRERLVNSYEHDTLIESIAVELERDHGFTFVSDARLTASVNVSRDDDDTFLSDTEAELADDADWLTIRADLDVDGGARAN